MSQEAPTRRHVPALDGVRGLAILLVLVHHLTVMSGAVWLDRVAVSVGHLGWIGVDLFFVLSGFLITGILYDSREQERYFRTFYARRTLRIFPLYYAVVFFSLVVLPWLTAASGSALVAEKMERFGSIEDDALYYWLYLSNFAIAHAGIYRHGILDVSWSLAIEEQFYLLWPMFVYWLSHRRLLQACGLVVLGAVAFRCLLVFGLGANSSSVYVLTPSRLDALAVGAWIALMSRQPGGSEWLLRRSRLMLLAGGGAFLACVGAGSFQETPVSSSDGVLTQSLGFTALAVSFGGLLIQAVSLPESHRVVRLFSTQALRTLGKYSYAIYLFHLPIRAAVRDLFLGPQGRGSPWIRFPTLLGSELPGQLLFFALAAGLTLFAAWLSWQLYEKHFLKLKRRFPSGEAGGSNSSRGRPGCPV